MGKLKNHLIGLAEEEVDRIMRIADTDGSGEIEYSEWIVATTNKKKLLSRNTT